MVANSSPPLVSRTDGRIGQANGFVKVGLPIRYRLCVGQFSERTGLTAVKCPRPAVIRSGQPACLSAPLQILDRTNGRTDERSAAFLQAFRPSVQICAPREQPIDRATNRPVSADSSGKNHFLSVIQSPHTTSIQDSTATHLYSK